MLKRQGIDLFSYDSSEFTVECLLTIGNRQTITFFRR